MELIVKFRDTVDAAQQREVLRECARQFPGVQWKRLFEDAGEPELATIFLLDLPDGLSIGEVTRRIGASPSVEYAHPPHPRR